MAGSPSGRRQPVAWRSRTVVGPQLWPVPVRLRRRPHPVSQPCDRCQCSSRSVVCIPCLQIMSARGTGEFGSGQTCCGGSQRGCAGGTGAAEGRSPAVARLAGSCGSGCTAAVRGACRRIEALWGGNRHPDNSYQHLSCHSHQCGHGVHAGCNRRCYQAHLGCRRRCWGRWVGDSQAATVCSVRSAWQSI